MKTVGVVIREFKKEDIDYIGVRKDMLDILSQFDINVIAIPIDFELKKVLESVNKCDGIILSGGSDILEQDYNLVKYLYQNNIPTLGICMGMQTMAMAYNGKKEAKIANHQSEEKYVHAIFIKKSSLLYSIIKQDKIWVNSRHNWCIPHTNFLVSAKSTDNIIEAIEEKSKNFFLGVQWHPESLNDKNSYLLFKKFVDKL